MELNLRSNLSVPRLAALTINSRKAVDAGIKAGFTKAAPGLTAAGRAHIQSKLGIKKKSALNGWKAKLLAPQNNKPTALLAQIRQKWLAIHETGGTIKPKSGKYLFIPYPGVKRISYAKLKAALANGELVVKKMAGRLVVFRAGFTPKGKQRKGKAVGYLVKSAKIRSVLRTKTVVMQAGGTVSKLLDHEISAHLQRLSITQ